jgi:hypothetical protein
MQIGTPSDSSSMRSEVRFVTEVEALVSCENSQAWVEHDVHDLPARTPFRVRIIAFDVDGMPVSFTRAEIAFLFDNKSLSVQWSRGSNEYLAIASEDLTKDTGEHTLVVRVTHGWSQADSRTRDCVLLHRVITVIPDRSQVILAGCLASVLLLATGGVGYVLLRNKERALSLFLSFLSFEGLMLIEVLLELWGTVNPSPHPHLTPRPHAQALIFSRCACTDLFLVCARSSGGRLLYGHGATKPAERLGSKAVCSVHCLFRPELPSIRSVDGCQNANHSPEVFVSARSSRPDGHGLSGFEPRPVSGEEVD